jgi:hypothetical protein
LLLFLISCQLTILLCFVFIEQTIDVNEWHLIVLWSFNFHILIHSNFNFQPRISWKSKVFTNFDATKRLFVRKFSISVTKTRNHTLWIPIIHSSSFTLHSVSFGTWLVIFSGQGLISTMPQDSPNTGWMCGQWHAITWNLHVEARPKA